MTIRFRRRLKIAPGVSLNLGRGGASLSAGVRGAHVTVGRGHVRDTVGLPGTGISTTRTHARRAPAARRRPKPVTLGGALIGWIGLVVIFGLLGFHGAAAVWTAFAIAAAGFVGGVLPPRRRRG